MDMIEHENVPEGTGFAGVTNAKLDAQVNPPVFTTAGDLPTKKGFRDPRDGKFDADGNLTVLHPTKGFRKMSAKRLKALETILAFRHSVDMARRFKEQAKGE